MLTEINGQRFNVGAIRNRLNYIAGEARDSELRVVTTTADDLIVALLTERTQLRGTLSLAEEGLANYAQELEGAKHDIERLMASVSGEANEVERLHQENERLQDEDRIWEKHGLVQIVWERDQLRKTLNEVLEELRLADSRHDLQAKIILAIGAVSQSNKHGG